MQEDWNDCDHLMRCTGDVYTIHYDESLGCGYVERWDHGSRTASRILSGGPVALGDQWNRLRGSCFVPKREHLLVAGFPEGMV